MVSERTYTANYLQKAFIKCIKHVEAMGTHNPGMTPKVHVLVHHVPEYVRRAGIQLGPTSEQAPKSQHTFFGIFYHRFKVICTNPPSFGNVY